MAKYKIAQVIDKLNPGGAERVAVNCCNLLVQKGHSVTLVTTMYPGALITQLDTAVKSYNLARSSKWSFFHLVKLGNYLKQFDIIHVHSTHNLRYVYVAKLMAFNFKPVFFHHHYGSIDLDYSASLVDKWVIPNTYLFAVSNSLKNWAIDQLKMKEEKICLLSNTVVETAPIKQYEPPTNILQIVLVSNFRREKNIEFSIQILFELLKKKNCHLTIYGMIADEAYYEEITNLIQALNLKNHISIFNNSQNVQAELHRFHLALHTAKSESGPLVLIEYMLHGLPFITYKTGEVVATILNEFPELILDNFNIACWIEAMQQLHLNKQLNERLKKCYSAKFSIENYYERAMQFYTSKLSSL